jgi:hypothetical protein
MATYRLFARMPFSLAMNCSTPATTTTSAS